MKKFTFMLIAAFMAVASWAGAPVKKATALQPQKAVQLGAQKKAPKLVKATAPFKVTTPATNRLAAKAKANARRAPKKAGVTDLLTKEWMLCSEYYTYSQTEGLIYATPAAGGKVVSFSLINEKTIGIEGFITDATETVEATFTTEVDEDLQSEGVIAVATIADGQTLMETDYGPIILTNYSGETDGEPMTAYVYNDGTVVIDAIWAGVIGGAGQYAGYLWTDYCSSVVVPVNGTMTWRKGTNDNEVPVVIIQDEETPKFVEIFNFADEETAVEVTMKADQTFKIECQYMFDAGSTYGVFYTYATDGSNVSPTITGTGTEKALTFDTTWTLYAPETGYWYNVLQPATIALTAGEFAYPEPAADVAATPADPEIVRVNNYEDHDGEMYGSIFFTVPTVDVDENDLIEEKLYYQILADINGEIAPVTFTTDLYIELKEDMTEIPYTFTDNYDFQERDGSKIVFLNYNFNKMYDRIGVQSIYYGGGEKNTSKIAWADVEKDEQPVVSGEVTFNFNEMDVPMSWNTDAIHTEPSTAGDITEQVVFTEENVTLAISPKEESASNENRFWYTSKGPQLRMYSGTLTFSVPDNVNITSIVFNYNGKYWGGNNNAGNVTADSGEIADDAANKAATWTGKAQSVEFTIGANTQINSIVVTYEGEGGVEPVEPVGPDGPFTFDDGTMQGWTTIDADGDGYTWVLGSKSGGIYLEEGGSLAGGGHNESADLVVSGSYSNVVGVGALTPDNFLVSPQRTLGGSITFYACGQDASYASEHFGVFVSTKGNTEAEDFVKVDEWTMKAAPSHVPSNASAHAFRSPNRAQGSWYEYTVDLSQFEGQEGYVAIRHFNVTDMFMLDIDDISFGEAPEYTMTPAEGIVESLSEFEIKFNDYTVAVADNAKATLKNETTGKDQTASITAGEKSVTIVFEEITEAGEYTLTIPAGALINADTKEPLPELTFKYTIEETPELVELPEGVEPEEFTLTATGYYSYSGYWLDNNVEETRLVAFDGKDVYVQGLAATYFPEGYAKGTLTENNQVVFKSGQLIGEDEYGPEYLVGFSADEEGNAIYEPEFVFDFDSETRTLTLADGYYIAESAYQDKVGLYAYLETAVYTAGALVLPDLVELPEGVEAEAWTLEGFYSDGESGKDVQLATEVAFDGNDIYAKGLAYWFEDAWLKGTIENGIATFPAGQFVGRDEYGKEFMVGLNENEDICDIQYAYDAEAKTLTQVTPYVMESESETGFDEDGYLAFWGYWEVSYFYAGEPVEIETVEAPEGLKTDSYIFSANELVTPEEDEDDDSAAARRAGGDDSESEYVKEPYSYQIQVGFDGNDVYFQGFNDNTVDMWMKGTLSEDGKTVTIPASQYMGYISSLFSVYDFYVTALSEEDGSFEDIVLNYDAENGTFSTSQIIALNGSKHVVYPYQMFTDVEITKMGDYAATPADPEITGYKLEDTSYPYVDFYIPAEDVDGEPIMATKLFYTVWVKKDGKEQRYTVTAGEYKYVEEDMVEIPYTYDDSYDIYRGGSRFYFNPTDEVAQFENIGVQSIYYGGGECNATNIIWMDGTTTTGINDINTANNAAVYYDLQGRKVTGAQKGLLIKQTRNANGNVNTVKVVRK